MAVFKCKICGGALEVAKNQSVAVCEHCRTKQTIPSLKDEKKPGLFNRANTLRLKNEYKAAAEQFDSITDYKDSSSLKEECLEKAESVRMERERKEEEKHKAAEVRAKKKKKLAIICSAVVSIMIVIAIVLNTVIVPNNKYNDAVALMEEGNIVEAYEAFVALGSYKDSSEKALSIYIDYKKEKLKTYGVGSVVGFGSYEQDNNSSNGKEEIEWIILEKQDNRILVISKYALDCKPYNISETDVTWELCSLREWLNDDFINSAFSDEEKAMIPTVTVSADNNPKYSTNPGNATQDRVFLLSITEANKYFSSDSIIQCEPTDYAKGNGVYVSAYNGNCWWWLRSPGIYQNYAAYIDYGGDIDEYGYSADFDINAVRPALWINLNS